MKIFPENFNEIVQKLERLSDYFDAHPIYRQSRPVQILGELSTIKQQYISGYYDKSDERALAKLAATVSDLCEEACDLSLPEGFESEELYRYLTSNLKLLKS